DRGIPLFRERLEAAPIHKLGPRLPAEHDGHLPRVGLGRVTPRAAERPARLPAVRHVLGPRPPPRPRAREHPPRHRSRPAPLAAVTIGARDRLGLLGTIAGAFAVSGISILSARAFTTPDGVALDAFDVRQSFAEEGISDERWDRFAALLGGALEGTVDLDARV